MLEGRIVLATLPASLASDPGGGATSPLGLTPAQVAHLYGFDDIFFQGGIAADGSGATIAIVDPYSDPDITKDLTQFDQAFGLPARGSSRSTHPWAPRNRPRRPTPRGVAGERRRRWTSSGARLAPGASILLVEVPGGTTNQIAQNLIAGVGYASSQPAVSVISMSWVIGQAVADSVFTAPVGHQGITYVAGGRRRLACELSGDSATRLPWAARLLGARRRRGGLHRRVGRANGGGGVETLEPQPDYQVDAAIGYTGGRAAPDVAFDAGTQVAVYDSYDYGATPWVPLGGTSIGALRGLR